MHGLTFDWQLPKHVFSTATIAHCKFSDPLTLLAICERIKGASTPCFRFRQFGSDDEVLLSSVLPSNVLVLGADPVRGYI